MKTKPDQSKNIISRTLWFVFGTISLILGTIGIPLPLLPTAPFYLFTLYAYAKSSKRLSNWLENNPFFGPRIKRIREKKGLTKTDKILILVLIYFSMTILAIAFWETRLYVSILAIAVVLFETWLMLGHIPTYIPETVESTDEKQTILKK